MNPRGKEGEEFETVQLRLSDIDGNRADNINPLLEDGMCWLEWPDEPWSIHYYFTTRGQDNGHIYFWIMKDLAWLQCWYYTGHIAGVLALAWSLFMVVKCFVRGRYDDSFVLLCQLIWLFGNFWWMNGELHDYKYPDKTSIYDDRARQAGYFLLVAFCLITSYYCIIIPIQALACLHSEESEQENISRERKATYDPVSRVYDRIMKSDSSKRFYNRFPSQLFYSWKDYENVHILMWLGKDTAWNWEWKVMWICFSIPTIIVGLDFIHKSVLTKRLMIDHAHYCAQFIWVFSNLIWAYGELFLPASRDEPIDFWQVTDDAKKSARWYSTWVLLGAFIPIVVLYVIWVWGTITGKISTPIEIRRKQDSDILEPMLH